MNQQRLTRKIHLPEPVFIALAVLTAAAARVFAGWGILHKADAVIIGTMASDIAAGRAFPLVYYGQNYMGSIEAWITAPLFMITGPTWWGMGFAPILVSSLGVIPFYLLAREIGGIPAGYASAALWAMAPHPVMFYCVTPYGCWPEVMCGGALSLWLAVSRWKGEARVGTGLNFLIGLLIGLLLWTSLLSVPFVVTVFLFLILADRFRVFNKENAALFTGFLIGALPFVMTLGGLWGDSVTNAGVDRLWERAGALAATFESIFVPDDQDFRAPARLAGWAVLVVMSVPAFAISGASLSRAPGAGYRSALPVTVFTVIFLFLFLINDKSLSHQVRYLLPVVVSLVTLAGAGFAALYAKSRVFAVALLGFVSVFNFYWNAAAARKMRDAGAHEMKIVRQAVRDLSGMGISSVIWVDYERVNKINYEAMIQGVDLRGMSWDGARSWQVTNAIEKDPHTAVVLTGAPEDLIRELEACCGGDYEIGEVVGYKVLHHMRPGGYPDGSIPPSQWIVDGDLRNLGDRRFSTTLASSGSFTIELVRPRPVTRIRAIYGRRQPALVSIGLSMDGGEWVEASPPTRPSLFVPIGPKVYFRALQEYEREWQEWRFAPTMARFIRFDILEGGGSNIYDIHELFVYAHEPGSAVAHPSIESVRAKAVERNVKTLAVNRWFAAHLDGAGDVGFDFTKPSLRPATDAWQTSRLRLEPGLGALVERGDAEELERRLKTADTAYTAVPLGAYTLFRFEKEGGGVWWTGFTLIDY